MCLDQKGLLFYTFGLFYSFVNSTSYICYLFLLSLFLFPLGYFIPLPFLYIQQIQPSKPKLLLQLCSSLFFSLFLSLLISGTPLPILYRQQTTATATLLVSCFLFLSSLIQSMPLLILYIQQTTAVATLHVPSFLFLSPLISGIPLLILYMQQIQPKLLSLLCSSLLVAEPEFANFYI